MYLDAHRVYTVLLKIFAGENFTKPSYVCIVEAIYVLTFLPTLPPTPIGNFFYLQIFFSCVNNYFLLVKVRLYSTDMMHMQQSNTLRCIAYKSFILECSAQHIHEHKEKICSLSPGDY